MIFKGFAVICALTLLSAVAHAAGSPPKELYGKSIIITWTEHHNQRQLGQGDFRDVDVSLSRKIYISTKGQWFDRFATTFAGRGAGLRRLRQITHEAGREAIGTSGTTFSGGLRQVQFNGKTITTIGTSAGGLARRTTIEFNENFTTCDARIIFAKQTGTEVVVGQNLRNGQPLQIRSATVNSVSCSIRDGNVFAE
jgi:hypothetical protein